MLRTIFLALLLSGCISITFAQDVKTVKFDELNQILQANPHQIKVVNFWATWCKPCIEELPYFEALQQAYDEKNLKVILVSLDFTQDKAAQFVSKKNINSEVLFLDETDHNTWINKISPDWSGAIPATLVIDGKLGKDQFFEKKFEKKDLFSVIEKSIN